MLHVDQKHFEVLDLTMDDVIQAFFVFSLLILGVFVLGLIKFQGERRKLSWVISLLGSSSMTLLGTYYILNLLPRYEGIFTYGENIGIDVFHAVDNYAAYACIWFALINLYDLTLGLIFYRKYLDPLTAMVHHPVFIWIMYSSTTGKVFHLEGLPYARTFMLMTVEELPTFLLALGSVFPQFRTDIGFGLTFFLLRLAYHVYFFSLAFTKGASVTVKVLLALTLTLHAFWFKNWIVKYGKKFFDKEGKKK